MKTLILGFCFILVTTSLPAFAQIDNLSQAINESGRLRMLSQRMTKAYILQNMDIQPAKNQGQLTKSVNKFESNVNDLEAFVKENQASTAVLVSLGVVKQEWASYKAQLLTTDSFTSSQNLLELSDRTLMVCEKLVSQLEALSSNSSARLVNLSGRQRMLSQRIAKLYSAISASDDQSSFAQELTQSISEFDDALAILMQSPDNTHFVIHKLRKVETQWKFSKQGFLQLEKGASAPLVISMTTETILEQMNDITALYQEIDNSKQKVTQVQ